MGAARWPPSSPQGAPWWLGTPGREQPLDKPDRFLTRAGRDVAPRPGAHRLAQRIELAEEEVVGAVDHGRRHPRKARGEAFEVGERAVRVGGAAHRERRRALALDGAEVIRAERRRDERERGDPRVAGPDEGRDLRPERVADDREARRPRGLRDRVERGLRVLLLTDASPVCAARGAHAAEVEPQGGEPERRAHVLNPHNHRVLHVATVQRMGVTDHDARGGARRDGEPGLEDDVRADRETQRLFGYHAGHENTGRGPPRPTPVLTCFRTRRRIGAYLDGALEADATASAARHLAECASCRREAEDLRRMKALLQRVLSPETISASPDWTAFWPGILRGIEAGRRVPAAKPHAGWRRARWALGGALVASLALWPTLSQWQAQRQEQTQTAAPPVPEKPVLVSTT